MTLLCGRYEGVDERVIENDVDFEVSIGDTGKTITEVMDAEIKIHQDEQRLRPEKSEVDSRYVNLKFIECKKFIFFSNYNSPKSNSSGCPNSPDFNLSLNDSAAGQTSKCLS